MLTPVPALPPLLNCGAPCPCPCCQLSAEELEQDPVMASALALQQQQDRLRGRPPPPPQQQGGHALRLDLHACMALLAGHPDASVRRQVYELGVVPRGLACLEVLEELAVVRRKLAALYGVPYFTDLAAPSSLLGGSFPAAAFLLQLWQALLPLGHSQVLLAAQGLTGPSELVHSLELQPLAVKHPGPWRGLTACTHSLDTALASEQATQRPRTSQTW
ncbi:hypothetical protein V8C86DRAFT_405512 [Haematococcus lacustris]